MPDRILRAGILTSDRVNALTWPAEVFYRRLMSVADDYGRFDGRPAILRAHLYALKLTTVTESDVGKWLTECVNAGLVRSYAVDSKTYIEVANFRQRTRTASKWPAACPRNDSEPPADCAQTADTPRPYSDAETHSNSESKSDAARADGSALTDDAWLDDLAANPTYAGLNIRQEYGRMTVWCETNKKQPTRRRFVNWLNRCDRPMRAGGTSATPQTPAPKLREPDNWRELMRIHCASAEGLVEAANSPKDFGQLPQIVQQGIVDAVRRIPLLQRRQA